MANKVQTKLDLSTIWLFSTCSKAELSRVRKAFTEIHVPAGKVLCEEGAPGSEFFVILSGIAEVLRNGKKVNTLGPGQFFGELALLDHRPRTATVRSTTDMILLVLYQREFSGLLSEVPGLTKKLLQALAGRLRAADAKAFH
jgi:CRP/FNR family cyclic AMP-dependent transcriptional regulator